MSYQNRLVRIKIIPRFSVVFKVFRIFAIYSFIHLFAYDFHAVSRTPRSVRGPGASAGAFALPRCAPQGGCDERLDNGSIGVLTDWL